MASTPTKQYSSGLLDDFKTAKRSWKPKTPTSIKSKAKSADADLPSLFASAVSRSPMRRKPNTTTASSSKAESDKSASTSSSDSGNRGRPIAARISKPPLTPSAASDTGAINVPFLFKSLVSSSSPTTRRSPTASYSSRNASSLSPGKYKSKSSGRLVVKKREESPRRSTSVERPRRDSVGTGSLSSSSSSGNATLRDQVKNSLPRISPTKSKIKIKSRSSQSDYKFSPSQKGRDQVMKAISISTKESIEPPSVAKPKSVKFGSTKTSDKKKDEETRKPSSFTLNKTKTKRGESPTRSPAYGKGFQTASSKGRDTAVTAELPKRVPTSYRIKKEPNEDVADKSPKRAPTTFRMKQEPNDASTTKRETRTVEAATKQKKSIGKVPQDRPGAIADTPAGASIEEPVPKTASVPPLASPSASPAIVGDKPAPLKKLANPTSPRKPNIYPTYPSSTPRSKNRVMAVTPFSSSDKSCWPVSAKPSTTMQMTPTTPKSTLTHGHFAPSGENSGNDGSKENGEKEIIPLVSIDTSGGTPQMVISFDNDVCNPIDEDELSCSVATHMFGPPSFSPSRKFSLKAHGGNAPSHPASIVNLLSQEEQLELFKTLEKLHREKNT